ncbi:hypothetical protein [uncultured Bacteroides sp.]|nr:hypothetical protein [uncultured Bacteroides sp.]
MVKSPGIADDEMWQNGWSVQSKQMMRLGKTDDLLRVNASCVPNTKTGG